jgi:hypothetical protein
VVRNDRHYRCAHHYCQRLAPANVVKARQQRLMGLGMQWPCQSLAGAFVK